MQDGINAKDPIQGSVFSRTRHGCSAEGGAEVRALFLYDTWPTSGVAIAADINHHAKMVD